MSTAYLVGRLPERTDPVTNALNVATRMNEAQILKKRSENEARALEIKKTEDDIKVLGDVLKLTGKGTPERLAAAQKLGSYAGIAFDPQTMNPEAYEAMVDNTARELEKVVRDPKLSEEDKQLRQWSLLQAAHRAVSSQSATMPDEREAERGMVEDQAGAMDKTLQTRVETREYRTKEGIRGATQQGIDNNRGRQDRWTQYDGYRQASDLEDRKYVNNWNLDWGKTNNAMALERDKNEGTYLRERANASQKFSQDLLLDDRRTQNNILEGEETYGNRADLLTQKHTGDMNLAEQKAYRAWTLQELKGGQSLEQIDAKSEAWKDNYRTKGAVDMEVDTAKTGNDLLVDQNRGAENRATVEAKGAQDRQTAGVKGGIRMAVDDNASENKLGQIGAKGEQDRTTEGLRSSNKERVGLKFIDEKGKVDLANIAAKSEATMSQDEKRIAAERQSRLDVLGKKIEGDATMAESKSVYASALEDQKLYGRIVMQDKTDQSEWDRMQRKAENDLEILSAKDVNATRRVKLEGRLKERQVVMAAFLKSKVNKNQSAAVQAATVKGLLQDALQANKKIGGLLGEQVQLPDGTSREMTPEEAKARKDANIQAALDKAQSVMSRESAPEDGQSMDQWLKGMGLPERLSTSRRVSDKAAAKAAEGMPPEAAVLGALADEVGPENVYVVPPRTDDVLPEDLGVQVGNVLDVWRQANPDANPSDGLAMVERMLEAGKYFDGAGQLEPRFRGVLRRLLIDRGALGEQGQIALGD